MIDTFVDWFVGSFDNKKQALSEPFKFKQVHLTHEYLGDNTFLGKQQTVYTEKIYRTFKIKLVQSGDTIISKNYKLDGEYIEGCDTIFTFEKDRFVGELKGCDCIVDWKGEQTYVKNGAILLEDNYLVFDRGFSVETDKYVWGSAFGYFDFARVDKKPLLIQG